MDVRRAGPGDAAAVAQLLHDFNTEFDTSSPGPHALTKRLERLLEHDDLVVLLAEHDDRPAGLALLTFRPTAWDAGPIALLDELYVRPQLRNRSIGTALLHESFALARRRGSETFEVNVDEGDTDARRFYERHGIAMTGPDQPERGLYYFRRL